jgi:5-methylcytosine-specific restriction enzyme subunit McrC
MMRLVATEGLDEEYANGLRTLTGNLSEVTPIRLTTASFRRIQVHGNNAYYSLALKVCALVHDALLPTKKGRGFRFRDVLDDEIRMSQVFEDFVFNFFRLEQARYTPKRERIEWNVDPGVGRTHDLLPGMYTDVSLRSPDRTIIVDTKYYRAPLSRQLGSEKLRSENLYQIFSYLKNLEGRGGSDAQAEGILLYPAVDREFDVNLDTHGHRIRACTINLNRGWQKIHEGLLQLLI